MRIKCEYLTQVRVSQEHEHFLINPFGLLYHEVSASKLIKVLSVVWCWWAVSNLLIAGQHARRVDWCWIDHTRIQSSRIHSPLRYTFSPTRSALRHTRSHKRRDCGKWHDWSVLCHYVTARWWVTGLLYGMRSLAYFTRSAHSWRCILPFLSRHTGG